MANNILTMDMITRKALQILENSLALTRTVNRQYDDSYAQTGAKIGSTLRIRLPDRAVVARGNLLQVNDYNEQNTTLTVDNQIHTAVNFTSQELTMSMDQFAERILEPRVSQMAASIDWDVAGVYRDMYNSVGTPGTTPSSSRVIMQAGQKLNEAAAGMGQRYIAFDPAANTELVEGSKNLFNPSSIVDKQYKSGIFASNVLGFDELNMTQSIRKHLTGTRLSTGATVSVAVQQGASAITLTGLGANARVNRGDVFAIAGIFAVNPQTRDSTGSLAQFVATQDADANAGGVAVVPIAPAIYEASHALATVTTLPQTGMAVVFMGAPSTFYPQNLFYNKDAIAFATADLIMPEGVKGSRQTHNGISMRIIRQYDINNDTYPCRIVVLYGYGAIRPATGGRIWG